MAKVGRKKLAAGEVGSIRTDKLGHKKYEARARVGCIDGTTREVRGRGATAETARAVLRENARKRAYVGTAEGIDGNTTLLQLAERTLANLRAGQGVKKPLRPQTIDQYETVLPLLKGINKAYAPIGQLRLVDLPTRTIASWLETVSVKSPSTGKRCKSFLTHVFDLAIRHDVQLWGANPARSAVIATVAKQEPVTLSNEEVAELRALVVAWQTDVKRTDLTGIVDGYIALGCRPNELFALRWDEDVDLASSPATVTIAGTVVRIKGVGLVRQDFTKTEAGYRKLTIPDWYAAQLLERHISATSIYVYPNEDGGLMDEQNVAKRWAAARGEKYKHVKLKSFRQAMATRLERFYDNAGVAARQLGHSNTDVTRAHYIRRAVEAGDYREALEELAPK